MTQGQNNSDTNALERMRNPVVALGILAIGAVAVLGGVLFTALRPQTDATPLYPAIASPTLQPILVTGDPQQLTFTDLNTSPGDFRNERIQVTGNYTPVSPPSCRPYTGPEVRWSLVAEGLQLNAIGYETLLTLLAPGTEMTLTGVWRAYQGPLGCGKGPAVGTLWYLQVERILAPNPLLSTAQPVITVVGDEQQPPTLDTPPPTLLIEPTAFSEETPPTSDLTQEPPPFAFTATPEPTQLQTTPLVTTPLSTPLPSTPDGFPTVDPNATPTLSSNETPTFAPGTETPVFPTNTPSGTAYPPPTATQQGYP